MSAPSPRRQVDLGPGVPRMDLEPLDLPMDEPSKRCPTCVIGLRIVDRGGWTWVCTTCNGTGKIGGGR